MIFGSLTIIPVYFLAYYMYGKREALLSGLLLAINPLHWLISTRAISDAMGLFFIMLFIFFLYRAVIEKEYRAKLKYLIYSSLLFGFGLGVRAAYLPYLVFLCLSICMCFRRSGMLNKQEGVKLALYPLFAFIGSVLFWLTGQIMVMGYSTFMVEQTKFMKGHFMEWGGTVITNPDMFARIKELFVQDIMVHGLGTGAGLLRVSVGVITFLSIGFYIRGEYFNAENKTGADHGDRENIICRNKFLISWMAPFLLWVLFFQNLNNPRHIISVMPALILMLAKGSMYISDLLPGFLTRGNGKSGRFMKKIRSKYAVCGILIVSLFFVSSGLASANARRRTAMVRLVDHVRENYDPAKTIIFAWETKRLFDYYAPEYIIVRGVSSDIEEGIAANFYGRPEVVLITSDMIRQWRSKGEDLPSGPGLKLIKGFRHDPYVQNSDNNILLYRSEET